MTINFKVDPYYDDFDPTKNFHRILFKPGKAVQARELTQSQSILQDQVTKFADNIFKQNSPVTGGQVTTNFECFYVKLQSTYNNTTVDVTKFKNLLVKNADGTVIARVIAVSEASGEEPPTLILSYKTGSHFADADTIYDVNSNLAAQTLVSGSTGPSSVASIADGVFYILGNFVQISAYTVILEKYSNTPSKRIGLEITETIYDYIDDPSLLDPAVGASNYQAPGADRYVISLALSTRPIQLGDDQNFVELVRVTDGSVQKLVDGSVYNVIDDYFAKRDYETNGDYVVNDFKLTPRTNDDASKYTLSVGKGLAYVHGYRVENEIQQDVVSNRARTTHSANSQIFIDYGSYFYVDTVRGANNSFFDTGSAQTIDLHCVTSANVNTSNSMAYTSTKVGTGYIRSLVYDSSSNTSSGNTFVYKAYVHDVQVAAPTANATGGGTNTITLPAYYTAANDAFVGVDIQITQGQSAGDFRTITAYNGVTKVATVNQNWTTTPASNSVFTLNYNISDVETLLNYNSGTKTIYGTAKINTQSKVNGLTSGDTILENITVPEMLFKVGAPYVATIPSAVYTSQHFWRNVAFNVSGGAATAYINYEGATDGVYYHLGVPGTSQSSDVIRQNYTVIVTDPGLNSNIVRGDIIPWTTTGRTLTLDGDGSKATLSATDITYSFTADIISKVSVIGGVNTGYVLKYKNLIQANTSVVYTSGTQVNTNTYVDDAAGTSKGQVYITNAGLVTPGQPQSLYLSDVKRIVKILDTVTTTTPTTGNMGSYVDVTNHYIFDNGQRDSFYDHATITLRTGAPQPKGNLLVYVDYYQHAGGDGYFSVYSYLNSSKPEQYTSIPSYTSKHGTTYFLRDSLDFRPARQNAQSAFTYLVNNNSLSYGGPNLPVDLTTFVASDYTYYLGRKDKLVVTKDKNFQMIEGAPSLTPISPTEPDGSLVLANITHQPYTGYIPSEAPAGTLSDLSIEKVQHKRFTMQDIANIENRVNNIEYYTSLSLLEQKASTLQISDAYGLNRFKNGIMVDDFSSFATADTSSADFNASINRREHIMSAAQNVQNFPLKSIALLNSNGALANTTLANLGYSVNGDGKVNFFGLPYSTANVASQKFASRTVNVNPFSFTTKEGQLYITPNVDTWVDTNYAPSLLITDPNMQVFQSTDSSKNIMAVGDWKTIPGTTTYKDVKKVNHTSADWGYGVGIGEETQTWTYQQQAQATYGSWKSLGNSFSLDNGFITDVSVQPYIRSAEVAVRGYGMLFHADVGVYFDGVNVDNFVRKPNIIELTGVSGTFQEDDIIGYYSGGSFHQTGIVLGVYQKDATNVRLYVAGDPNTTTYNNGLALRSATFDANGNPVNYPATGTVSSTEHFGGRVKNANTSTQMIKLSGLASSANSYYVGNTIYFCTGTGIGESATIDAYYGANQTAHLSTSVTFANNDIYSIGTFKTDETGSLYGIFNIPPNSFHNGQRVLRIDNSNGNKGSETTYCESTYYAEGLQTTQIGVDFASSPAAAKNTVTRTITRWKTDTVKSAWDPLCQSFIFDTTNYPNGLFLDSISLFFATKPTSDKSPVTLSIVGTLNGYPNGQTLDHSVVTLTPDKVVTSSSPHYLDASTKTSFKFTAPVFLQPGVLYAFMLKSNSSEYTLWSASNGDTAKASSVKNLPSDPIPSTITKIGSAPYVGGIFLSQNAQTWTADQNQSLMFVLDRCVFSTSANPTISFVVPKKLPQRTLIDQAIDYLNDANNIVGGSVAYSDTDVLVDAFNVTTTDLLPTTTNINYSYNATLVNGNAAGTTVINPGKFGTPTNSDLYLNDGKGERKLFANTNTSFTLNAQLSTGDNAVTPMISDAGLTTYAIEWSINNCELSNNLITVTNGGSSYNVSNTLVTFSAPTIGSDVAQGVANVVNGVVDAVYVTYPGSGYIKTPTVTISVSGGAATGATATIAGETSKQGGNALARYVTKKVVLDQGFDSGDINVYLTAYRPTNTDIHVYYKILNRNDTQKFDDGSWQLMTKTNSCDAKYSQARDDLIEYTFAPGTNGTDQGYVSYTSTNGQVYTSFSQFAIKVVFTSSDKTYVPFATDMRAIALPANVNTTF